MDNSIRKRRHIQLVIEDSDSPALRLPKRLSPSQFAQLEKARAALVDAEAHLNKALEALREVGTEGLRFYRVLAPLEDTRVVVEQIDEALRTWRQLGLFDR